MSEPTASSPPAEPDPGEVGALWGALLSPERTFRALKNRPRWLLALILLVGLAVALSLVVSPRMDMEKVMRDAMESRGQEISEEQLQQQVEIAESFGWLGTVAQLFLQPAIFLLLAAIFLALFRLFGSDIDFRQSLSTAVHGFLPYAVATLLSIPVILARTEISMEEVQSGSFLMSNAAAFAPEGSSKASRSLLGSLDLFSFWTLALMALGYRIVAAVGKGVAWGVVLGLWAVYVAGKVALTSLL